MPKVEDLNGTRRLEETEEAHEGVRKCYSSIALKIARCALISQSAGRPLKKQDLIQELQSTDGEIPRHMFQKYMDEANRFLKERLGFSIAKLGTVKLSGVKVSPTREEYIVIAMSHRYQSAINKVVSKSQLWEWGITCLGLIMIVLKGDGITFNELHNTVAGAQLLPNLIDTDDEMNLEDVAQSLRIIMHKLVGQRIFEEAKNQTSNDLITNSTSSVNRDPEEIYYYIGPSAKHLISSRELYQIIVTLYYPRERIHSPEFIEINAATLRSLKLKLENSILGSVGDYIQ